MRLFFLLSIFCLQLCQLRAQTAPGRLSTETVFQQQLGKQFPSFDITLQDGNRITSNDIKGKVVYANFWFEACNPCRAEFKALNALYDSLKDNPDFVFIAFTFEPAARLPKIIKDYNLQFPIASISRTECERLKLVGMGYPTSIITDQSGRIVYYHAGGPGSVEKANEKFKTEILPVILQQF